MRIIRISETLKRVPYTDRHLRELEAAGKFPRRIKLNPPDGRSCGHLESEVDAWIEARAASRETTDA